MAGGKISLDDVVVRRVDPVWGLGHRTGSLRTAEQAAKRRGVSDRGRGGAQRAPRGTATKTRKASGIRTEYLKNSGHAREQFDAAVSAIRKVHEPNVVLRLGDQKGLGRSYGHFDPNGHIHGTIRLKDRPQSMMRTAVHEVAHAIDWQVYGDGFRKTGIEGWAGEGSPQYAWRGAVRASGAKKRLKDHYPRGKFLTYIRNEKEMWARSYEQWIALRSGDATLQRQLAENMAEHPTHYWPDDEFGPIAAAFDQIFGVKP